MNNYTFYRANKINNTINTVEYATNNNGEGLFQWVGGDLKQQSGNSQFRAYNSDEMLRKINRLCADDYTRFFKTESGAIRFNA